MSANGTDRDDFYAALYLVYKPLQDSKLLIEHIDLTIIDVKLADAECIDQLKKELEKIEQYLIAQQELIPGDDIAIYQRFNIWYDNLRSCSDYFEEPSVQQEAKLKLETVNNKIGLKLQLIKNTAGS